MNNKRLILNVTFVLVLFLAWNLTIKAITKRHPDWVKTPAAATTGPAASPTTVPFAPSTTAPAVAVVEPASRPTTAPVVAAVTPPVVPPAAAAVGLHVEDATGGPAVVALGSNAYADGTFPMQVMLDPRGASIGKVTLNDFYKKAQHVDGDPADLYEFQSPLAESPDDTRPLATASVTVDGAAVDLTNGHWRLSTSSADSATFTTRILDGTAPVVELTKTYKLLRRDAKDGSAGFDVALAQTFRNLTGRAISVSANFNGPTAPLGENSRSEDRRFIAAFDEGDHYLKTDDTFVNELNKAKGTTKDLATAKPLPLVWIGVCNSYFDAIVRQDAGAAGAVHVGSALAVEVDDTTHNAAFNLTTAPFTLAAGAVAPFDLHAFFGPKQRQLLKNDYYAAFPRGYDVSLVYISKFCGLLTFGWLINVLYFILWCFHRIFFDWGLAIIGLVVLVRTCLHPITKRSQIQMMGMSKMGPEIERLKKKYGDDKEGLNKAMMTVYKEQGMAPILGCLPMLLQTPIWLALWNALQSTFEIRQAGFLRWGHVHLTWIADLSQPDKLIDFASAVHLPFGYEMHSVNVLPLLLAGVFAVQQRMMPQPANMTPEQEQQRKMMKWMPLIYPLFFYVSPSGLNLYILTSTSLGIIESRIVRRHIKEREEAEKAGRIIVDAGKSRKGKREDARSEPPKKPGAVAGFIANLQAKAEQVVREAERKKNEGRR